MKNTFIFLTAISLLTLSCSSESNENTFSNNNGEYGLQSAENGQVYKYEDDEKYTLGGLRIYMADKHDHNNGHLILTEETMLEVGTMSNGEVSLALPQNVNSRFLTKIDEAPSGMTVKPLGVEVWFYTTSLRLIDKDGKHVGDLRYGKKASETEYHYVDYWYFLENLKINGIVGKIEYHIEAKQGWNKVYLRSKRLADQSSEHYATTDLSKVPDGLKWFAVEFAD